MRSLFVCLSVCRSGPCEAGFVRVSDFTPCGNTHQLNSTLSVLTIVYQGRTKTSRGLCLRLPSAPIISTEFTWGYFPANPIIEFWG